MKLSTISLTDPTLPLVAAFFTICLLCSSAVIASDPFTLAPEASAEGAVNTLTWTATGDPDVVAYRIEWSADGITGWSPFGTLQASNDTLNATRYRVRDQNPRSNSYYRIVTITREGGETFSQVATVLRAETVPPLKVAYDPDEGAARLDLHLQTGGTIEVRVLDAGGAAVYHKSILAVKGRSNSKLNLGPIAPGSYRVELSLPEGTVLTESLEVPSR